MIATLVFLVYLLIFDQYNFRAQYRLMSELHQLEDEKEFYKKKLNLLEKDDYKGWSKELKAAGYATDRKYPQKLISIIERYQLYRFDSQVLGKESKNNDRHTVVTGDTLYSLSKKYKLSIDELKQLNGLDSDNLFVGQVLFVKPMPKDY